MDFATSSILPVRTPKNVLWVGTYYYTLPHNLENMRDEEIWRSEQIQIRYVDIHLEFQFLRYSDLEFRVTFIRPGWLRDMGYILQFHCSVSIFDDGPKVRELVGSELMVFKQFWLNDSYYKRLSPSDLQKQFELKILVRMLEYDDLPTNVHQRQEDEFHEMRLRFFNSEPVLSDMGYLLKCPAVRGIFTGRQDLNFSELKNKFIRNTATHATEIAGYLRGKGGIMPLPLPNFPLILNQILNGERVPISNNDLITLYFEAHRVGLNYLAEISRDCILERIEDQRFMLDAFHAADRVNDEILFEIAARYYHSSGQEILTAERWRELSGLSNVHIQFILYSLRRSLRKEELQLLSETASASESSSFTIF